MSGVPERAEDGSSPRVRLAHPGADCVSAGELLDRFNREFDCPTPGAAFMAERVEGLLGEDFAALIAEEGEEDAGIAVLRFRPNMWSDANEAYLAELYVVPAARRRGLGGELLDAALALSRERGCDRIELGTDEGDVDAHRLYERWGFSNLDPDAPPESAGQMLWYEREL